MENENVKGAEQTAENESTETTQNEDATQTENENSDSTGEAKFTQAQVDDLIAKRLARETKKFEKKLLEVQKKSETEPSDAEKITDLEKKLSERNAEILKYKLAKYAAEANVKAGRADAFSRLVDLTDVDITDDDALKDAIADAVKQYPEFLNATDNGADTTKGYIKAGAEKKDLTEEEKLRQQVRQALGLK
jgi:hypothetical protein